MKRLLLGLMFVAVTSHATEDGDHTALFEEAVDAINWNFDEEWAYTETRLEDDVLWVARFDPRKPAGEQWSLRSVGGRAPTRDELHDFADDKEDHDSSDGSQRTNIVGADTLELVSIRHSLERLKQFPFVRDAIEQRGLELHGARFSIHDGILEWLGEDGAFGAV